MKSVPHKPGVEVKRSFTGYTEYQEALWQAFDDFYFSKEQLP